jgi:hypothetical protein
MIHAMLSGYHSCFVKPPGQDSHFVSPEYRGTLSDTATVGVTVFNQPGSWII